MSEEAVLARVFFHTGDTEGVREAEIMSRSIKAIAFRRDALDAARKRVTELGKAGVYLLIGPDQDQPEKMRGYIGESEDVGARLKHHADSGKKEFWQQTIVLVAKDDWLTKAHVRFIESQMMGKVNKTAWIAQNEQTGSNNAGQLPVADKEIVSQFIRQAEVLVGMLGCDIFKPSATKEVAGVPNRSMSGQGYSAKALFNEETGQISVLSGSIAKASIVDSMPKSARAARERLIADGVLVQKGDELVFVSNYTFNSLSAAAQVIAGGSVSGPVAWKIFTGGC